MKLNSKENVKLCLKSLIAKQLEYYSVLCRKYESLAKIAIDKYNLQEEPDKSISEQVQSIYGKYLSRAVLQELSFLKDDSLGFDEKEIQLFKDYACISSKINKFTEAYEKLDSATFSYDKNGNKFFSLDKDDMKEYHKFMKMNTITKNFDDFIKRNPKVYIGKYFYGKSIKAIKEIKEIDPSHITNLANYEINPASFAATISGYVGSFDKYLKKKWSKEEQQKYSEPISKSDKFKRLFARKGTLLIATSVALVISGSRIYSKSADEFNNLSATENNKNGYQVYIVDSTQEELSDIKNAIDSLKNSPTIPTHEQLYEIRDMFDKAFSDVIEDLMYEAFAEKYKDYYDIEIKSCYDFNANSKNPYSSTPDPEEYIKVTAKNAKDKNVTMTFSHFWDTSILDKNNTLGNAFDREAELDGVTTREDGKNSPGVLFMNDLNRLKSSLENYNAKTDTANKILDLYSTMYDELNHLAGTRFHLFSNNMVMVATPEKLEEKDYNTYYATDIEDTNEERN